MHKSQLIQILRTLSKKEIRDLKKWLRSPFHNQRQDVVDLFDYCFTRDYLEREDKLDKEMVFEKIFPNEAYDDAKIRQTMYFMRIAVEDFLIYNSYQTDEREKKLILTKTYRERKLYKLTQNNLNQLNKAIKKTKIDRHFHLHQYLVSLENYDLATENSSRQTAVSLLQSSTRLFDHFFISEQLRNICSLLSYSTDFMSSNEKLIESILDKINNSDYTHDDSITLYYLLFNVLRNNNDEEFDLLKDKFTTVKGIFSYEERKNIILIILNYCISRMNRGAHKYIREAFELYKIGIKEKIFISDGFLDHYSFRNITNTGLHLGEFDWIRKFINTSSKDLHPNYRESFTNFGLGSLHFKSRDYDTAMKYLARYEHDDILLNLNSKSMLLRMYYEQDELNALESLLESFKVYLKRKKGISETYVLVYGNLIKYTKKLVRVNPYDKAKKEKLRQEILEAKPMINKEWFLEQLEAMG